MKQSSPAPPSAGPLDRSSLDLLPSDAAQLIARMEFLHLQQQALETEIALLESGRGNPSKIQDLIQSIEVSENGLRRSIRESLDSAALHAAIYAAKPTAAAAAVNEESITMTSMEVGPPTPIPQPKPAAVVVAPPPVVEPVFLRITPAADGSTGVKLQLSTTPFPAASSVAATVAAPSTSSQTAAEVTAPPPPPPPPAAPKPPPRKVDEVVASCTAELESVLADAADVAHALFSTMTEVLSSSLATSEFPVRSPLPFPPSCSLPRFKLLCVLFYSYSQLQPNKT